MTPTCSLSTCKPCSREPRSVGDLSYTSLADITDSAIGVLKVTVANGRGFKATKLGGGAPDPYVTLSLGAKPAIARTKTINSS